MPPIMQRWPIIVLPEIPVQRRNGRVRADDHVVTHLDLIVQLDPVLDHRIVDGAPIDGGVGADLHVIADPHAAHLRHLHPGPAVRREAEAVGADHRPGVQDAALRRCCTPGIQVDPRHQPRVGADARAALHDAARDRRARARRSRRPSSITASGPTLAEAAMRAPPPTTALG